MTGRQSRNRFWCSLGLIAAVLSGCAPQEAETADAAESPERPATAEAAPAATVAASLTVRLDSESSDPAQYDVQETDAGLRIQTGPAGIAYRPGDAVASGDFGLQASFEVRDAPVGYREAFGLFLGGLDLAGADLEYTYLLIRPTGDFLIKRRLGDITETLVDWTAHDAVASVGAEGDRPVNTLSVVVSGADTHFNVNGVTVATLPTTRVRPHGVAGLRVNHRLNVLVSDWALGAGVDS